MKKLTFISCLLLSGCLAGAMAANKKQPIYKDAKAPIEEERTMIRLKDTL